MRVIILNERSLEPECCLDNQNSTKIKHFFLYSFLFLEFQRIRFSNYQVGNCNSEILKAGGSFGLKSYFIMPHGTFMYQ